MTSPSDRPSSLSSFELLRGIPESETERILGLGRTVEVKEGEQFIFLGGVAEHIYFVRRGRIRLTMPIAVRGGEQELLIEEKGRGDTVGWSALVPPFRFTLDGRAKVASELVEVSGEALRQFLGEHPLIGFQFLENMAQMIGRRLLTLQTMWARAMQRTVESFDEGK